MPVSSSTAAAFHNTVADDTARLALTLTSADYNKIYLQLDNGKVWRVANVEGTPTWQQIGTVTVEDVAVPPMPSGGTERQALVKLSGDDYDVDWSTLLASDISDFTSAVNALIAAGALTTEQLQDIVGALVADNSVIDFTYDDSGNAITATIKTSGVTAGSYGSTTQVPVLTITADGRISAASTATITVPSTEDIQDVVGALLSGSGDITVTYNDAGNVETITLANTTASAGTYGAGAKTVSITVDAKGRITAISDANVAIPQLMIQGVVGAASVANGIGFGPLRVHANVTFVRCDLVAKTAPTGAALIVDVKKATTYGGTYTSIFSAAPQIAASANTGSSTSFSTTTADAGDYLRFDVTQVGSTVAGSDVAAELLMTLR